MNKFTKTEVKYLSLILLLLVAISIPNFISSLRRARDAQRKADIGSIYSAIIKYQEDFGGFPLSIDGKIAACAPVSYSISGGIKTPVFSACDWGTSSLADLSDKNYPAYLKVIPDDPWKNKGFSYYYISNGKRFQIYGSIEGSSEDEYDPAIIKRGLRCGFKICNFGKAFARTPLNISIEEYEQTL